MLWKFQGSDYERVLMFAYFGWCFVLPPIFLFCTGCIFSPECQIRISWSPFNSSESIFQASCLKYLGTLIRQYNLFTEASGMDLVRPDSISIKPDGKIRFLYCTYLLACGEPGYLSHRYVTESAFSFFVAILTVYNVFKDQDWTTTVQQDKPSFIV